MCIGQAADLAVGGRLDLAGVQPGAQGPRLRTAARVYLAGAADRARRPVEGREQAVAGGIDDASAQPRDLRARESDWKRSCSAIQAGRRCARRARSSPTTSTKSTVASQRSTCSVGARTDSAAPKRAIASTIESTSPARHVIGARQFEVDRAGHAVGEVASVGAGDRAVSRRWMISVGRRICAAGPAHVDLVVGDQRAADAARRRSAARSAMASHHAASPAGSARTSARTPACPRSGRRPRAAGPATAGADSRALVSAPSIRTGSAARPAPGGSP